MVKKVVNHIKKKVSPKTKNIEVTGSEHHMRAFVEIATGASGIVDAFKTAPEELLHLDEVKRVYVITGTYDVLVEIECPDMFHLTSMLKTINGFVWVKKMRTSIVEAVEKYERIYEKAGKTLGEKEILSNSLIAYIGVDVIEGTESRVTERLKVIPEIKKLYHVTGTHDLVAIMVCKSIWELSNIFDRILEGPFVVSTVTDFVVRIHKHK